MKILEVKNYYYQNLELSEWIVWKKRQSWKENQWTCKLEENIQKEAWRNK